MRPMLPPKFKRLLRGTPSSAQRDRNLTRLRGLEFGRAGNEAGSANKILAAAERYRIPRCTGKENDMEYDLTLAAAAKFFRLAKVAAHRGGFYVSAGGGTANVVAGEIARCTNSTYGHAHAALDAAGRNALGDDWYCQLAAAQPWPQFDMEAAATARWDARTIARAACRKTRSLLRPCGEITNTCSGGCSWENECEAVVCSNCGEHQCVCPPGSSYGICGADGACLGRIEGACETCGQFGK